MAKAHVPAKVILVTGPTATGKTTLTNGLCPALNKTDPTAGPIANPVGQDWFFDYQSFANDTCEMITCGDHTWRNWEASSAVDWKGLVAAVKKAVHDGKQRYVIVEGFLLLECEELVNMASAVVRVELAKSEIWARRLARAQKLKGLSEGMGENKNYEVLPVYASEPNREACKKAVTRTKACEKFGEHAWLRLYFDEVISPAIDKQRKNGPRGKPELVLSGTQPPGESEWTEYAVEKAVAFLLSAETFATKTQNAGGGKNSVKKPTSTGLCRLV